MLLLNHGTVPELRAFARNANEKQSSEFFIQSTVFDTLNSLQEDIELYKQSSSGIAPSASQLAEFYSGGNSKMGSGTLKSLCRAALRLTPNVVHHIGVILNTEDPETAYAKSNKQIAVENMDCRIYRKVLTANSLRLSKVFSRTGGSDTEQVQINTLYRMRLYSAQNDYKPVPAKKMDELYLSALSASIEVKKFEDLLDGQAWPDELLVLRQNMLRTSLLDSEIELNKNNTSAVFQPLFELYKACFPNLAEMKLRRWLNGKDGKNGTPASDTESSATVSGHTVKELSLLRNCRRRPMQIHAAKLLILQSHRQQTAWRQKARLNQLVTFKRAPPRFKPWNQNLSRLKEVFKI